jgi:hypothetical protein
MTPSAHAPRHSSRSLWLRILPFIQAALFLAMAPGLARADTGCDNDVPKISAHGVIVEIRSGELVLQERMVKTTYRLAGRISFSRGLGGELSEVDGRKALHVGLPIRLHFTGEGQDRKVQRIDLEESAL